MRTRVTVCDSGFCYCFCVMSFKCCLTPLFVNSISTETLRSLSFEHFSARCMAYRPWTTPLADLSTRSWLRPLGDTTSAWNTSMSSLICFSQVGLRLNDCWTDGWMDEWNHILNDSLTEWLTGWSAKYWLTARFDWVILLAWHIDDWLADWLTETTYWLADHSAIYWLTSRFDLEIGCQTSWQIDDWLIDWLTDWIKPPTDWLVSQLFIDWLSELI